MGNSPSASGPAAPAASVPSAPSASAPSSSVVLSENSKKNGKSVVTVPAENVTVTKGGKRRRLRGGVASVHFDLVPHQQPSDAMMERVTSASSGGKRRKTRKQKSHKKKSHRK